MKFRDQKTGEVFDNIKDALEHYCPVKDERDVDACKRCAIGSSKNTDNTICTVFSVDNPTEAARLMGYEVIEDENEDDQKPDPVNHPDHYTQGGIECIDAIKAAVAGLEGIEAVCVANAIKYIWRFKSKNGVQDLEKAIWYINRLKEEIGNG